MPKLRLPLLAVAALFLASATARPLTAQIQVGGGVGFLFDESNDYTVFSGQLRLPLGKTNWVVSPRVETFPGLHLLQVDLNLLYQIQTAAQGVLQPYVGIGGGIAHISDADFSETKRMLNLIAGTRIVPRRSIVSIFLESEYSAATSSTDRQVIYGGLLLRLGGR